MYVIVSYDISDDALRTKVANLLEDNGKRVQYSVFECHLDAKRLDDLIVELDRFVEDDDSIRIYQICEACLKKMVILNINRPFEEWGSLFKDNIIATAILDRLLHHSHVLLLHWQELYLTLKDKHID